MQGVTKTAQFVGFPGCPKEIVHHVLYFVGLRYLTATCSLVCKQWYLLSRDDEILRNILKVASPRILTNFETENIFSQLHNYHLSIRNMTEERRSSFTLSSPRKKSAMGQSIPSCFLHGCLYVLGTDGTIFRQKNGGSKLKKWKRVKVIKGQVISFKPVPTGRFYVLSRNKNAYLMTEILANGKSKSAPLICSKKSMIAANSNRFLYWIRNKSVIQKNIWSDQQKERKILFTHKIKKIYTSGWKLVVEQEKSEIEFYSEESLHLVGKVHLSGVFLGLQGNQVFQFQTRKPTSIEVIDLKSGGCVRTLNLTYPITQEKGEIPKIMVVGDLFMMLYSRPNYTGHKPHFLKTFEVIEFLSSKVLVSESFKSDCCSDFRVTVGKMVIHIGSEMKLFDYSKVGKEKDNVHRKFSLPHLRKKNVPNKKRRSSNPF